MCTCNHDCSLHSSGYGNITPVTQLGQSLCILFALIGIPITLLALKSVGELITEGFTKLIRKFETKLLKREHVYRCEMKCAVVSFLVTVSMLCGGAGINMLITKWTFLEGVYFWFISFTTIGFGDYIPTRAKDALDGLEDDAQRTVATIVQHFFGTLWYILGLCMVSSVISSFQAALDKNRCCQRCLGCFTQQKYVINIDSVGLTEEHRKRPETDLAMSPLEGNGDA